jgi:hypothetical protein
MVRVLEMKAVFGKVFTSQNGVEYGTIRKSEAPFPSTLANSKVLGEDECGNYFFDLKGSIYFWDHETSKDEFLAKSLGEFISSCSVPTEVELKPAQVGSVWVDPDFAKQFGIKPKP